MWIVAAKWAVLKDFPMTPNAEIVNNLIKTAISMLSLSLMFAQDRSICFLVYLSMYVKCCWHLGCELNSCWVYVFRKYYDPNMQGSQLRGQGCVIRWFLSSCMLVFEITLSLQRARFHENLERKPGRSVKTPVLWFHMVKFLVRKMHIKSNEYAVFSVHPEFVFLRFGGNH